MRVLIAWGSKRGGTEGIARTLGEALTGQGVDVTLSCARRLRIEQGDFDAAIIGGALYSQRWQRDARRFVARNVDALRRIPVWFFSSGPLDDSAERAEIPATAQVASLMKRVGAQAHRTFGGRLTPDAKGFPASAMAKHKAGDYRSLERVRAWALELSRALPSAKPAGVSDAPPSAPWRIGWHGALGWAVCASLRALLHQLDLRAGFGLYLALVPLVFSALGWLHFRSARATDAVATALAFTALFALLDGALMAARVSDQVASTTELASVWPLLLVFGATWISGTLISVWSARSDAPRRG